MLTREAILKVLKKVARNNNDIIVSPRGTNVYSVNFLQRRIVDVLLRSHRALLTDFVNEYDISLIDAKFVVDSILKSGLLELIILDHVILTNEYVQDILPVMINDFITENKYSSIARLSGAFCLSQEFVSSLLSSEAFRTKLKCEFHAKMVYDKQFLLGCQNSINEECLVTLEEIKFRDLSDKHSLPVEIICSLFRKLTLPGEVRRDSYHPPSTQQQIGLLEEKLYKNGILSLNDIRSIKLWDFRAALQDDVVVFNKVVMTTALLDQLSSALQQLNERGSISLSIAEEFSHFSTLFSTQLIFFSSVSHIPAEFSSSYSEILNHVLSTSSSINSNNSNSSSSISNSDAMLEKRRTERSSTRKNNSVYKSTNRNLQIFCDGRFVINDIELQRLQSDVFYVLCKKAFSVAKDIVSRATKKKPIDVLIQDHLQQTTSRLSSLLANISYKESPRKKQHQDKNESDSDNDSDNESERENEDCYLEMEDEKENEKVPSELIDAISAYIETSIRMEYERNLSSHIARLQWSKEVLKDYYFEEQWSILLGELQLLLNISKIKLSGSIGEFVKRLVPCELVMETSSPPVQEDPKNGLSETSIETPSNPHAMETLLPSTSDGPRSCPSTSKRWKVVYLNEKASIFSQCDGDSSGCETLQQDLCHYLLESSCRKIFRIWAHSLKDENGSDYQEHIENSREFFVADFAALIKSENISHESLALLQEMMILLSTCTENSIGRFSRFLSLIFHFQDSRIRCIARGFDKKQDQRLNTLTCVQMKQTGHLLWKSMMTKWNDAKGILSMEDIDCFELSTLHFLLALALKYYTSASINVSHTPTFFHALSRGSSETVVQWIKELFSLLQTEFTRKRKLEWKEAMDELASFRQLILLGKQSNNPSLSTAFDRNHHHHQESTPEVVSRILSLY